MPNFSGLPTIMPTGPTGRSATALLNLGTLAFDGSGNEYRYVCAQAAISALDSVTFNGSATGYDAVRKIAAANEFVLGVATAAFATALPYGFIQTKGVVDTKVIDETAAGKVLVADDAVDGALKLGEEAESLAGNRGAVCLETGDQTAGSAVYLG